MPSSGNPPSFTQAPLIRTNQGLIGGFQVAINSSDHLDDSWAAIYGQHQSATAIH